MPVRRIPPGRCSLTGWVPAAKAGGLVEFESALERDFVTLLVFDRAVIGFEAQPCRIPWTSSDGQARHYIPDFFVQYRRDGETVEPRCDCLCEVKYRHDLATQWRRYKPKFMAARGYARTRGWRFQIITEREIRTPYLDNARFLLRYRTLPAHPAGEDRLRKTLIALRRTTPGTLIAVVSPDETGRATLLPSLWKLIEQGQIGCNLRQPLTMESPIWLPAGAAEVDR